ncbi:hypothetical protein BU15DRAFT_54844 [Melanogaster broomeanus]|nr:hypothetical protein BU15DRAFT_54844 [Melanogaster broomeanus]
MSTSEHPHTTSPTCKCIVTEPSVEHPRQCPSTQQNRSMSTPQHQNTTSPTCKCIVAEPSASRNLVVCIDGTSKRFGTKNTNVVELYSQVVKNATQLTYYTSGLGTFAKIPGPSDNLVSNTIDMAIGRNIHTGILAAYRWLSDNYQDGTRIFLFGKIFNLNLVLFNHTMTISPWILKVGLLLPGNNEQIPFAFELYSKSDDEKHAELAEVFKKTFCRKDVRIHFVGVWDTVSSVGIGRNKTLPCTTSSCEHICHFRHALALDERRVRFLPEYAFGGRSETFNDDHIREACPAYREPFQTTRKEVWFAGTHSDVPNTGLQSGDIPLLWMRSQAAAAGLDLEPADTMWKISDLEKQITPSLKCGWWFLELLPLKRLLYYNSDEKTHKPHLGNSRIIVPGQKVHASVLFRHNYRPSAQFYESSEKWPVPMFWNDPISHQRLEWLSDAWEKDFFLDDSLIRALLASLAEARGQANLDALDHLAFMANFSR